MTKGIFAIVAAAMFLSGCSTTSGTGPVVSHSGFDNAAVVRINPHGNACTGMVCTGLGGHWNAARPDEAILVVSVFNSINAITGAKLNIDGEVHQLRIMETFTNFSEFGAATKESRKGFLVSTSLIRKITTSKKTWLRVNTTSGYMEDAVVDGSKDSKAFHALKRFLSEIDRQS